MLAVELIARWLHIVPAITLVGGTIFMRFAYSPAIREQVEPTDELQSAVRRRWARLVMASALFLLLSGFYNAANAAMNYNMTGALEGLYNPLLGVKLLGGILGVFYIASLLSGRSEAAEKFQKKESTWLNVNVALTLIIVCIAGVMKVTDREPKEEKQQDETTQIAPLEPGPG